MGRRLETCTRWIAAARSWGHMDKGATRSLGALDSLNGTRGWGQHWRKDVRPARWAVARSCNIACLHRGFRNGDALDHPWGSDGSSERLPRQCESLSWLSHYAPICALILRG